MPSVLEFLLVSLADSLSLKPDGLFQSTRAEDNRMIQEAHDMLQDRLLTDLSLRVLVLRDVLYNRIYQAPYELDVDRESLSSSLRNEMSEGLNSPLFDEIHRANVGCGYEDTGWLVTGGMKRGKIPIEKGGLHLWADPDCDLIQCFSPLGTETRVSLRLPKNLMDPGLYIAVGNAGPVAPQHTQEPIVRLHFNLLQSSSAEVMKFWTLALNAQSLPFCFSMGYDQYSFTRHDPAILSIRQEDRDDVLQLLRDFIAEFGAVMNPSIPALTKFLALGIAYSEVPDPALFSEPNFHLHHAQIIASGFLQAWEEGQDLVATALAKFQSLDIDLNHPYLNPQSEDFNFY